MRLIDADALIAEMHSTTLEDGEDRRTFYEVIERQPTIDAVEVVHGEWISLEVRPTEVKIYWNEEEEKADQLGACTIERVKCSVCGWTTNFRGYKKAEMEYPFSYCPNCGAKMGTACTHVEEASDENMR